MTSEKALVTKVDWGEIHDFPFTRQRPETRYFLCCRLKCSRWTWLRWARDMRQETLLRGLIDCCCALGWVPWVLVFDNMKTHRRSALLMSVASHVLRAASTRIMAS